MAGACNSAVFVLQCACPERFPRPVISYGGGKPILFDQVLCLFTGWPKSMKKNTYIIGQNVLG